MNGGTCIDGVDSFTCSCPLESSGVLCHCDSLGNFCQDLPWWYQYRPYRPLPTVGSIDPEYFNLSVVYSTSSTFTTVTDDTIVVTEEIDVLPVFPTEFDGETYVTATPTYFIDVPHMMTPTVPFASVKPSINFTTMDTDLYNSIMLESTDRVFPTTPIFSTITESLPTTLASTDVFPDVTVAATTDFISSMTSPSSIFTTSSLGYPEIEPTMTLVKDQTYSVTPALDSSYYELDKTHLSPTPSIKDKPTSVLTTPDYDYYSIEYTSPTFVIPTSPIYSTTSSSVYPKTSQKPESVHPTSPSATDTETTESAIGVATVSSVDKEVSEGSIQQLKVQLRRVLVPIM